MTDRPVGCQHSDYHGPERRVSERRGQCDLHSGLEKSYDDLKDLQEKACKKIDKLSSSVEGKVPMKLFYVMIGLVVAILAFQWTTYERVQQIALDHQETSGELKVELQKIVSNVDNHQTINKIELNNLTRAVDRHQNQADKEIGEIKTGIKEVKKDIQELKNKK